MLPVHQPLQLLAIQLTRQPQRPGSLTDPPARRLALTGVVVLTALRDLLLVIQLLRAAHPDLADRQHDPGTPGASLMQMRAAVAVWALAAVAVWALAAVAVWAL